MINGEPSNPFMLPKDVLRQKNVVSPFLFAIAIYHFPLSRTTTIILDVLNSFIYALYVDDLLIFAREFYYNIDGLFQIISARSIWTSRKIWENSLFSLH